MAELAEDPWAPPKFDAIAALTERFNLQPHPEGGFYAETYRASAKVSTPSGERNASTAIYFLITPGNVSRLHRIKSDEAWHFYLGGPMTVALWVRSGAASPRRSSSCPRWPLDFLH